MIAGAAQSVLLVTPKPTLADLSVLTAAWADRGITVRVQTYEGQLPTLAPLLEGDIEADAVLLTGDGRRAPSTVLPGPILTRSDGRRIAAAWLPLRTAEATRRFAEIAAEVQRRERQQFAVALLSQWHPRYLRIADRVEALLRQQMQVMRWTGDIIDREGMLSALNTGLGLGLYFGHGRPSGWVGYRGVRGYHFIRKEKARPFGALMSLCCRTASRRRLGLSYTEALILQGVAASSFGAVSDTLYTDNTRWALGLCDALSAGVSTIGELIVKASPVSASSIAPYRLIGDPLAPLASTDMAAAEASRIETYP